MVDECAAAIVAVKNKHSKEIEKSLKVLMRIRDSKELRKISCPHCKEKFDYNLPSAGLVKNQIEASKWILRRLAPEKSRADIEDSDKDNVNLDTPLSKEEEENMESYLGKNS